ncbi:MAG: energy-coupling factor transporter transmembrane component T family protein [Candidatus Ranarchaeia archaeon]
MSVSALTAFRYRYKETFIHDLDPRTKLYLTIVLSALTMFFADPVPLFFILVLVVLLIIWADSLTEWLATLRGLKFLLFFVIVLNYLFNSLNFALAMAFRLLVLSSIFSIFFLTVHPDDLAQSLIQLRLPFEFAFAMSMATRFVPTLAIEAETIMDAQKSRGLELDKGGFLQKIRNFTPILIPLIVSSIRRALTVAESIESRAFGSTAQRTFYYLLKFDKRDAIVIFTSTILVSALIYLQVSGFLSFYLPWLKWGLPF